MELLLIWGLDQVPQNVPEGFLIEKYAFLYGSNKNRFKIIV